MASTSIPVANATEKRAPVTVNGKTASVTKARIKNLQAAANKRAALSIDPYISMANEVKSLWEANEKARKDNWFWSNAVDLAFGSKFPSKAMIDNAVKAAKEAAGSGVKNLLKACAARAATGAGKQMMEEGSRASTA